MSGGLFDDDFDNSAPSKGTPLAGLLKKAMQEKRAKGRGNLGVDPNNSANSELLSIILDSQYVINIADDKGFLFSRSRAATLDCTEDTISRMLGTQQHASYKQTNYINCQFEYRPLNMAPIFSHPDLQLPVYNTYRPPTWQRGHYFHGDPLPPAPSSPPQIYNDFLEHLCAGDKASIEYVYDWMATALTSRNRTILVAIGDEGSGKGTFGLLLKELVGSSNYIETRDEVLKRNFNGQLMNKRIVYINEVNITGDSEHNRLKNLVNEELIIEAKGVDEKTIDNYASIFLSSNHLNAVKPTPSDRRLSIIQLTDRKLNTTTLIDRLPELYSADNVGPLASWLLARKPAHNMLVPFRSSRYDDVKEASLSEWEHYLVYEWTATRVGKFVSMQAIKTDLKEGMDTAKVPGRVKIGELAKKYAQYIEFKKENGVMGIRVLGSPTPPPPVSSVVPLRAPKV